MHVINSIRGSLHLEMLKDSSLSIGDFLMSRGPLYIKCMEGAQLDIGDNVFFNHNCSITTAKRISIGSNCMIANNVVIVDHNHVVKMEGSNPHEIRLFSGCPYYFTLPMDGNNNSFPKHLRQPCKERRSFGVDVHHIVFSKCTIKCRKCGGADCSKSP